MNIALDIQQLPFLDIHSQDYLDNLHRYIAEARERSWLARFDGGLMALDYEAIRFVLRDKRFRTGNRDITAMVGQEGTPFARFHNEFVQAHDGDTHKRLRNLIAGSFTPGEANKHRAYMREVMNASLDAVVAKGQCDFVDVSARYPITVFCRLLGVSPADIDKFKGWLDGLAQGYGNDAESTASVNRAVTNLFDYVDILIKERKASSERPDDLLQSLIEANADGDTLSDEELRVMLLGVLFAGYDTTKNQLNWVMNFLCEYPEEYARLVEDSSREKPFIEECLRLRSPVGMVWRVANEDIDYRGITIPANTMVASPTTAGGLDPSITELPNEFDPDRADKKHIAFGHGLHMCVGMWLGRALLEEAVPLMVKRLKNPRIVGECRTRPILALFGLETLPIAFDS